MKRSVIVLKRTKSQRDELIRHMKQRGFRSQIETSIQSLYETLEKESPTALFIDLDTISLNNTSLLRLHQKSPLTSLVLISSEKSHPEMEEAIGRFVYACISKPLDMDEVDFWLKSILDDDAY